MNTIRRDRRQLLKRLISSSAALPFLGYLPSLGAAEVAQKRLILMFSPNGTMPNEFFPDGSGKNFTFKRILKSLDPYKNQISVYRGLKITIPQPGCAHARGMGSLWTGAQLNSGTERGGNGQPFSYPKGPSIDQIVANKIGAGSAFKSLEFGFRVGGPRNQNRMCHTGSKQPITPEQSPYKAFSRVYNNFDPGSVTGGSGGGGGLSESDERNLRVGSVLDAIVGDFSRVQRYLSAEDKLKLDRHTETIRDIERTLAVDSGGGGGATQPAAGCKLPNQSGARANLNSDASRPAVGKLFADMIVSSFACDRTRVASMQWGGSANGGTFPHLNLRTQHHQMSHKSDNDKGNYEGLLKINEFYAQQFAYIVKGLNDTPDPSGAGSLLDNSYLIWGNELGKGNSHSMNNIPFVAAGSAGGYFKTGEYFNRSGQVTHARLLTSIGQAFGVNMNGIGFHPNAGPLDGIKKT